MTKTIKRYSEAFKRQVVSEYENGSDMAALKSKYAIGGSHTIDVWIRKYGREGFRHELVHIQTAEEVGRIKALEKQVTELQQALGRVTLEKLKLESMLEVLQGQELVKKNAPSSSRPCGTKPEANSAGGSA